MQINQVGEITFVKNWHRPLLPSDPLTGVKVPVAKDPYRSDDTPPTDEFYKEQFPAIDKLIKTPVAFAILAPYGWSGERCWYDYSKMGDYGWEPIFWRESSHKDKTFVQLYMRVLPERELIKEYPKFSSLTQSIMYSGEIPGHLPYLGCSSLLYAFEEPETAFKLPSPRIYYPMGMKERGVMPEQLLTMVRVARPAHDSAVPYLLTEGFEHVYTSPFSYYFVRGKKGIGSKEKCEY